MTFKIQEEDIPAIRFKLLASLLSKFHGHKFGTHRVDYGDGVTRWCTGKCDPYFAERWTA